MERLTNKYLVKCTSEINKGINPKKIYMLY